VTHRFVPQAAAELRAAARYYEHERQGLGVAFRAEVRSIVDQVMRFPEICQGTGNGAHRCCLKRFPYGVFYKRYGDEIIIYAVSHLHRRPDHWRDRL
jgi:hypothetical protein